MRIIARLDIKNNHVIKGIQLEGLRKVGKPREMAIEYYESGVDELVFMDAVASLYDRNQLFDVIELACKDVFVPIGVGGGLRNYEDVSQALNSGADKVIINTGAVHNLAFIEEIASKYGSQCVVGSVQAKRKGSNWFAYINNGREPTCLLADEWAKALQEAGAGEIMLTSVDQEGTRKGFDVALIQKINEEASQPIIVSGGYGSPKHAEYLLERTKPSAIAFASVLHYKKESIESLRDVLSEN